MASRFRVTDPSYVHLPRNQRNRHIYRIIPAHRFLRMLDTAQNVLVKPSEWDDPWENVVLKSLSLMAAPKQFHPHERVYAQCWTSHHYSDVMWSAYSHQATGVRLRSTPRLVLRAMTMRTGTLLPGSCFVGRVQYLSEARLFRWARRIEASAGTLTPRRLAQTLLAKRRCFAHEKEIRLIFVPQDDTAATHSQIRYRFDTNALVDQVMLHPLMPIAKAARLKKAILRRGFLGQVKRSLLYALPPPCLPARCGLLDSRTLG